ncbi:hypothetical protein B0H14DRAFT_2817970, partial [Mycena olivaceomarginata]
MPCLALLLACGAAALTAPAAPATRSPRRPPIPALHSLRLPAPLYLRPRPTLQSVCASPHLPRPRLACRLHPALCPHPAARSAHLFALTRFAPRFPPSASHVVQPPTYSRPRFNRCFALRPAPRAFARTPRPLGPRAFVRILRRFAPALYFRARASLRHPPHVCVCGSPPAPALPPGLASP